MENGKAGENIASARKHVAVEHRLKAEAVQDHNMEERSVVEMPLKQLIATQILVQVRNALSCYS